MTIEKTFRETPFNGYNRDDVNTYIRKKDEEFKAVEAELNTKYDTIKEENERLHSLAESLNVRVEEQARENLELSEEVMRLRNSELEQNSCICEKTAVIEELQKKNKQLEELYSNLKGDAEHREEILRNQENRLSDLSDKNKEFEASLQDYIRNANKLKEEAEAGLAINNKIAELNEVISAKDEKIKELEENWEKCKKDYLLYREIKNRIEKITDEAKKQADTIISEAHTQRMQILSETEKEANEIVEKAKYGTAEIRTMLANLKKAVFDINTKIEFAEMSIDSDKHTRKSSEGNTPENKTTRDELVRLLGLNLDK